MKQVIVMNLVLNIITEDIWNMFIDIILITLIYFFPMFLFNHLLRNAVKWSDTL